MSCELFIGNLHPDARNRDLEHLFGKYGRVVRCDLKKNYAFIEFEDKRDAAAAVRKENNRRLLGSEMTVEFAKGRVENRPPRFGGGDFRRPHSPTRFGARGRGRDRSPVGRNGYQNSSRFSPRGPRQGDDDRFQRRNFGRDSFNSGSPKFGRDRYSPRVPPIRERGNNYSPPRSRRFQDDRQHRGDRRDSFSGRPNGFRGPRRF